MKENRRISLSLNKKTISNLTMTNLRGGSSGDPGTGACGSGGGVPTTDGSRCMCK